MDWTKSMKPLSFSEIEMICRHIHEWQGGRLQEVRSGERWYELGFYVKGEMQYLLISLQPQLPLVLPLKAPVQWREKKTPVYLFLKAHVVGQLLESVHINPEKGRVISIGFSSGPELEIRLFPGGQNLIVSTGDKKISAFKVLDLPPAQNPVSPTPTRGVTEICETFIQNCLRSSTSTQTKTDPVSKRLQKKRNAREKMRTEIEQKKAAPFEAIGNWLKTHQSLEVPPAWQKFIDPRKSFAENLQALFNKAKETKLKIRRAEERLKMLEDEIASLEAGEVSSPPAKPQESILKRADAKGRTQTLASGHVLFVGKSGADNLKILRKASAWDYWLHLKDVPGSHGILRRGRHERLPDSAFVEALKHLVRFTYGEKSKRHEGERFEGLVAECRYVRPIKGDKLGRVNYQNERVFKFVFGGA